MDSQNKKTTVKKTTLSVKNVPITKKAPPASTTKKEVIKKTDQLLKQKESDVSSPAAAVVIPSVLTNQTKQAVPNVPVVPVFSSVVTVPTVPMVATAPAGLVSAHAEVLYKPTRADTKQVGHIPLNKMLKMLRYAARHGDYTHVYSIASVMVDNECVQCLRRELVEFMLGSGFMLWYPMHALSVLQVPATELASYFANVCFDASTSDFFMFPDLCTRRACDVYYNFARDLSITLNDAALNEAICALYADHDNAGELQARGITFAYALIAGINGCDSSAFDLSWLDVALRNAFFLSKFNVDNMFAIFQHLCTHYKFCEPYLELLPKIRVLYDKLNEGKPCTFHWNRGCRLIITFLIFFFFFKCAYEPRVLPSHAVIPTSKIPFVSKYDMFIAPAVHDYIFARFGNLKCNMFRGYLFGMIAGVPRVPLQTIAFPPFERNFLKSVNALWRSKYTNVTVCTTDHFLVSRLKRDLPVKAGESQKTIVIGPVFPTETDAIAHKIKFWMDKFAALKIVGKTLECVRLYFADNFANNYGGMMFIHVPLGAAIERVSEEAWGSTFVRLFAALCASYIVDIGLSRSMFYFVDGKIFCAAMWMPVVVAVQRYTVEQQLVFLGIDAEFYEKQKKYIL